MLGRFLKKLLADDPASRTPEALRLAAAQKAVRRQAHNPAAQIELGDALCALGQTAAAEAAYREAIARASAPAAAHRRLARLLLRAERPAEALASFRAAEQLEAPDPETLQDTGVAAYLAQDFTLACTCLSAAHARQPLDPDGCIFWGAALLRSAPAHRRFSDADTAIQPAAGTPDGS